MNASFEELRRAAPPIHVSMPADQLGKSCVVILNPLRYDERYDCFRYSEGLGKETFTEGDGSRENPYRYRSAAPVSAHYVIVDLWSRFRDEAVFITVNGWLLEVSPDGVTASDGHFTRLA